MRIEGERSVAPVTPHHLEADAIGEAQPSFPCGKHVVQRRQLEDDVVVRDKANVGSQERLPAVAGGLMVLIVSVEDRVQSRGVEKDGHLREPSVSKASARWRS